MAGKHHALTAAWVHNVTSPGTYTDGNGLTLRVSETGGRRWVQRVTIDGKARNIGVGGYPAVGLKEARTRAMDNLKAIREGKDPVGEKRAAKAEATSPTFSELAQTVIDLRRPTWSSQRHATQWSESLALHAFPSIGGKRITDVTAADALAVLTPIWISKPETATRVRQRMAVVFDYAIAKGLRMDNPANGSIDKALPRRPRLQAHHAALPFADLPAALESVRASTGEASTKLAFEFMVLTAARAGEVRGAVWSEIDLEKRTWTIPATRMKARKEHRVPLADRAMAILREMQGLGRKGEIVFQSSRGKGSPMSNMTFEMLLRRLSIPAVPHGFRSTFRDWTIEATGYDWVVGETALAHRLGNSVESAYARTDLFERRRGLMQEWADFVGTIVA
jgi:integrase